MIENEDELKFAISIKFVFWLDWFRLRLRDEPAVEAKADSDRKHCQSDVQWYQLLCYLIVVDYHDRDDDLIMRMTCQSSQ